MSNSTEVFYENEDLGLKISLEEAQNSLKAQFEGIDTIKSTTRTVFGASSLIVSLLGALQLTNVQVSSKYLNLYNLGIVGALIIYLTLIVLSIYILYPVQIELPVKPDWGVYYATFTDKSVIEIQRVRLIAYLNVIDKNRPVVFRLQRLAIIASSILPILVSILLLLSLIPRGVN